MENSEAQKWLNYYIFDYLVSRNHHATAEAFAKEANLQPQPQARGDGYLLPWLSMSLGAYSGILAGNQPHQNCVYLQPYAHFISPAPNPNYMGRPKNFVSKL